MNSADIAIAHPNFDYATRLALRLKAVGLTVATPVSEFAGLVGKGCALALVDASLLPSRSHFPFPLIILASSPFRTEGLNVRNLEGIVYEPLRPEELETIVGLALRRTESDQSHALIQSARYYALFLLDPNGSVTSWNPGAVSIYGYQPEDVIGKHFSLLYSSEDCAQGIPETELRAAAEAGYADDTRWLLKSNGQKFWAEGLTSSISNHRGELIGYAKITRDATERRNLEQQLERSNDELQRFAYTVSHDLQEPLRTIRSYAELLSRRYSGKLDKDADEFIQFLMDAAGRMTQLLRDLLAYSQAGRPDRTKLEVTSSANVLQWAIMNVDRLAKEAEATITYDPLPIVEADPGQLTQVFQHLLGNAIKYRGAEPPRIHISVERLGEMEQFAVRDNGVGVDPEHHERIFGVFKRLQGKEFPGTGIGLSICRKIIESHKGRIWVESEPRGGLTVKFTLPAHDGPEA